MKKAAIAAAIIGAALAGCSSVGGFKPISLPESLYSFQQLDAKMPSPEDGKALVSAKDSWVAGYNAYSTFYITEVDGKRVVDVAHPYGLKFVVVDPGKHSFRVECAAVGKSMANVCQYATDPTMACYVGNYTFSIAAGHHISINAFNPGKPWASQSGYIESESRLWQLPRTIEKKAIQIQ